MDAARIVAQDVFNDAAQTVDVRNMMQALSVAVEIVVDDARRRFVVFGRVRKQAGAAKGVEDCQPSPSPGIIWCRTVANWLRNARFCPIKGERGFAVHLFCHAVLVMAFAMLARGRYIRRGRCVRYLSPCSAGI